MEVGFHLRGLVCLSVVMLALSGVYGYAGQSENSPAEIQKERTALMKDINRHMKDIKSAVGKKRFGIIKSNASELGELISKIPELTPQGSAYGPKSRIVPAVWEKFSHYRELATASTESARRLAQIADGQEVTKVTKAFRDLARSCTACHKPYRKKKRSK